MKLLVGLDVSLAKTAVCVLGEHGKIMKEAQFASEPEELVRWIGEQEGIIAAIGLKVGAISRGRSEHRIRALAAVNPMLETATEPMRRARTSLRRELAGLERRVRQLAQNDPVCRRLMSMPRIGAVVALTYRSAIYDPSRFTSSKKVEPWVGLTPSRTQSGERDVSGGITKAGDVNLLRALYQAATVILHRGRTIWLRTWAVQVARRRGGKRAMVALARRIGVILRRMWVDDTDFWSDIALADTA